MTNHKWILVVEDDANDAFLTVRALGDGQASGQIIVVNDGIEALDCLYRRNKFQTRSPGNPAVVLLDLKMPKIDGLQVLSRIKHDDRLKSVPVVMFTSSREGADLRHSYELGANAYVVKPLGFQEFRASVQEVSAFWLGVNLLPPLERTKDDAVKDDAVSETIAA